MKSPASEPTGTVASRLKKRILHPWSKTGTGLDEQPVTAVTVAQNRLPARISEFLLVFRLRARLCSARSADVLGRAVRVVLVTCKHWFSSPESRTSDSHEPR